MHEQIKIYHNLSRSPFDHDEISVPAKIGIYFSATISVAITVYIVSIIDATILVFLNNASYFFELVSLKIDRLSQMADKTLQERIKFKKELTSILECHSAAFGWDTS
jgi:hypothetical protein